MPQGFEEAAVAQKLARHSFEVDGDAVEVSLVTRGLAEGIKLVALTGYGAEEDLRRAKEAGSQLPLVKPVDTRVLEDLLRNAE